MSTCERSTHDHPNGPRDRRRVRSAVRVTGEGPGDGRESSGHAARPRAGEGAEELSTRARAIVAAGSTAGDAGVDGFFVDGLAGLDPYPLLAAVAQVTDEIVIGSLVEPVGRRAPSVLAKLAATLDVVSSGRALLGLAPAATTATGALVDALEICRAMASRPAPSYAGEIYAVDGAWNEPRFAGAQPLPVVLTVGRFPVAAALGGSEGRDVVADLERLVRCAARHADICAVEVDALAEQGLPSSVVAATVGDVLADEASSAGGSRGPVRALALLRAGFARAADAHPVEATVERAEACLDTGWDGVVVEVLADVVATAEFASLVTSLGCLAGDHRP